MTDALSSIASDTGTLKRLAKRWGIARFIVYPQADSTQNIVRAMNDSGTEAWTLVVADYQTAGRGQHGRSWLAGPGMSLMFSLLLRPRHVEAAALLPIRIGMAIAAALDPFLRPGARAMLKWPNDVIVSDGKAGGILCESQIRNEEISVIAGVGLNARRFPLNIDDRRDLMPVFLEEQSNAPIDRLDLLEAIIGSLRNRLVTEGVRLDDTELREFARRDWLRDRALHGPATGRACGINREGHLQILRPNHLMESFMAGRVLLEELIGDADRDSP